MVEAIEDLFVPVLIYNNKPSDKEILEKFKEPSWNNPVTRFLKSDGTDVIARQDNIWYVQPMAARMVFALKSADRPVPGYLSAIAETTIQPQIATFAMHCYWEGEGKLGAIPGVSNTLSGWANGLEVVQVTYDPERVAYSKLVEAAKSFECASRVFAHSKEQLKVAKSIVGNKAVAAPENARLAKLSDQKYYLRNTPVLRSLPLTRLQSTKINSALKNKSNISELLSPRQKVTFQKIKGFPSAALTDFVFPDDDSKLAEYHARLIELLNAASKRTP